MDNQEIWIVVALPSRRAVSFGADPRKEYVCGPFTRQEAVAEARDQRSRRVYGRVYIRKEA